MYVRVYVCVKRETEKTLIFACMFLLFYLVLCHFLLSLPLTFSDPGKDSTEETRRLSCEEKAPAQSQWPHLPLYPQQSTWPEHISLRPCASLLLKKEPYTTGWWGDNGRSPMALQTLSIEIHSSIFPKVFNILVSLNLQLILQWMMTHIEQQPLFFLNVHKTVVFPTMEDG